jgi:hypothetical protein
VVVIAVPGLKIEDISWEGHGESRTSGVKSW